MKRPITIISLFSGYDSPLLALDNLHIPYHLICWSEIDPYAIKAHDILHPTSTDLNIGDIQLAEPPSGEVDLLIYSPPCQDISKAGRNKGGAKGSGTRSSLIWQVEPYIKTAVPKLLIMENVPSMATVHKTVLKAWQATLRKLGYHSMLYTFNALNCGIPQYRKRLFMISSRETPPLIMHPTIVPPPPLTYLDKTPPPEHLYYNRVPNKEVLESESYPYILGYTKVYDEPARSSYHKKDYYGTITTKNSTPPRTLIVESSTRARRLTTSERLRLQGLNQQQIAALKEAGISDTRLDKMAGNSICIPVLEHIFRQLFL